MIFMTAQLSPEHIAALHASAISDPVISARGYRTIVDAEELEPYGFTRAQRRAPGLLLPVCPVDGGNGLYVYRPDNPIVKEKRRERNKDGTHPCSVLKYLLPQGAAVRIDCPPICRPNLADPRIPLWITEGQKKADSLASHGQCAIALLGVWNFKGRNEFGGTTILADFDYIAFNNRDVRIVFDSDVMTKPEVRQALDRLTEHLQRKGAQVSAVYLQPNGNGKTGVDDYLAAGHTLQELEALIQGPRPEPKAAPPTYELLDYEPVRMSRPLSLIGGMGYAATWLSVRATIRESVSKRGEIVRHDPPKETTERRLFILRSDRTVFGDIGSPITDLGFDVHLPETPEPAKLLRAAALKRYLAGAQPSPGPTFWKVLNVVDHFIDFDRSLADQLTMCELLACYIISTYFLDAFTVFGFLWPNGDRGVGKTQLLQVIASLAYLGQVILAGGSYATLRDLADYGATLAFDDAEGLSDPKKTDPDKRNLLLAGNRKGSLVTVKELMGERWQTRYINTFCPRLFSAIRLPDPILASRTIVVPLVKTPDRARGNADPLDPSEWTEDRAALVDDLWLLGLAHIAQMPAYEQKVNETAPLVGRDLEPWRPILATASWLDDQGVDGLAKRMQQLAVNYQPEREDLEPADMTRCTVLAVLAICTVLPETSPNEP